MSLKEELIAWKNQLKLAAKLYRAETNDRRQARRARMSEMPLLLSEQDRPRQYVFIGPTSFDVTPRVKKNYYDF